MYTHVKLISSLLICTGTYICICTYAYTKERVEAAAAEAAAAADDLLAASVEALADDEAAAAGVSLLQTGATVHGRAPQGPAGVTAASSGTDGELRHDRLRGGGVTPRDDDLCMPVAADGPSWSL